MSEYQSEQVFQKLKYSTWILIEDIDRLKAER